MLKEFGYSLLEKGDVRQAMLARMRKKLALNPEKASQLESIQRETGRRRRETALWVLGVLILVSGICLGYFLQEKPVQQAQAAQRLEPLAPPPAKLRSDEQLLYWVYALYDVERLRKEFHVPKDIFIDANLARTRIRSLVPIAGPHALFVAHMYQSNTGAVK